MDLVELQPTMIRGNASEIMAVAGAAVQTRGVDTSAEVSDALQHAQQLARDLGCIVAVSGAVDKVPFGPCAKSRPCAKGCNGPPNSCCILIIAACSMNCMMNGE